jgi:FtsZ-binding cell division protein ZapB
MKQLERLSGKQDMAFLVKKMELIQKERDTLKEQNNCLRKEVAVYRNAVISK